jgi:hypothetical protein
MVLRVMLVFAALAVLLCGSIQAVADAAHNTVQDHADYRVSLARFLQ